MLAPGMNRLMWANPAVQDNIAILKSRGIQILTPGDGAQACGEVGAGRMPEPLDIRAAIVDFFATKSEDSPQSQPFLGQKIVITAGPTIEEIDPVRYISNYSSGKMGYALALAAKKQGAEVTLISGPVALAPPVGIDLVKVKSAAEMMQATYDATRDADIFIAAAAVADYRVANRAEEKLKKSDDSDLLTLVFTKNPDILATIAKGEKRPQLCIGFAAETDNIEANAQSKLLRKNVDMICLNDVSEGKVFGESDNEMLLFTKAGKMIPIARADKHIVAEQILAVVETLLPKTDEA